MPLMVKTLVAIEVLLALGLCLYRTALSRPYKDVVSAKAAMLVLTTPVVALLAGSIYVFYAYLVAAIAFTSRSRAELCGTYVLMLPAMPLLVSQTSAGAVYILPLSVILMMNIGALVGIVLTPPPAGRVVRSPYDSAVVLLLFLFVYIDGRNVSGTSVIRSLVNSLIVGGVPYLLLSRGLSRPEDIERTLLRLGLAATIGAIVGIFEMLKHWVLFQSYYDAMHVPLPLLSATLNMRGGLLRTGGPMIDYTAAGLFLAVALVLMLYLYPRFRPAWRLFIMILLLSGLFATQSRGAWAATLAGFMFVLVYRGAWVKMVGLAGLALSTQLATSSLLQGNSRLAETLGSGGAATATADYRKDLLIRGLQQVIAHPLFGQEPKALVRSLDDMIQGQHIVDFVNSHLYIAMTAGVPMFIGWVLIWSLPVLRSWQLRKAAPAGRNLAEVPASMIITVMVALSVTSMIDRNMAWPTLALGLAGSCFALAGTKQNKPSGPDRKKLVFSISALD